MAANGPRVSIIEDIAMLASVALRARACASCRQAIVEWYDHFRQPASACG